MILMHGLLVKHSMIMMQMEITGIYNYTDIDGEGNDVAASASWISATGALTPDNWVIMGLI